MNEINEKINAICYECKYYTIHNDLGLCNLSGTYKSKRNTCSYFVSNDARASASVKTDDLSSRVDKLEEKVKELETILNFLKR